LRERPQRALIAVGFLEYEREMAKSRMVAGVKQVDPVENLPQGNDNGRIPRQSRRARGRPRLWKICHHLKSKANPATKQASAWAYQAAAWAMQSSRIDRHGRPKFEINKRPPMWGFLLSGYTVQNPVPAATQWLHGEKEKDLKLCQQR